MFRSLSLGGLCTLLTLGHAEDIRNYISRTSSSFPQSLQDFPCKFDLIRKGKDTNLEDDKVIHQYLPLPHVLANRPQEIVNLLNGLKRT